MQLYKKHYPDNLIVIIDGASDENYLKGDVPSNTIVINSEYKKRGELLPYLYYLKHGWFKTAVIIHDSVFIQKQIDTNIDMYKFIWHFEIGKWDDPDGEKRQIKCLNNNNELLDLYARSRDWVGCFGAMSVVTHEAICHIDSVHCLANLIDDIKCRSARGNFERVFACILHYHYGHRNSMFNTIHGYCRWGVQFNEYIKMKNNNKTVIAHPLVKVWTGR